MNVTRLTPDMDRLRNQLLLLLLIVALAAIAIFWMFTHPMSNAEADWVPPKLTLETCVHAGGKPVRTFELHPRNLDTWMDELQAASDWKSNHYPVECTDKHIR